MMLSCVPKWNQIKNFNILTKRAVPRRSERRGLAVLAWEKWERKIQNRTGELAKLKWQSCTQRTEEKVGTKSGLNTKCTVFSTHGRVSDALVTKPTKWRYKWLIVFTHHMRKDEKFDKRPKIAEMWENRLPHTLSRGCKLALLPGGQFINWN